MKGKVLELAAPLLRALEPERAHRLTLRALEAGLYPRRGVTDDIRLTQAIWGLRFTNPIGVAAGFDKDARVPGALLGMGFGFAEVGTVTPKPQQGNDPPRLFRLVEDRAVINRMGFNNEGHRAVLARLRARPLTGVIGVNIGANADSEDRIADYVAGFETFAGVADYFAVNISSPNTPGLRDLQAPQELDRLLTRLMTARKRLEVSGRPRPPITVKLSPDLSDQELQAVVSILLDHTVDGIIVSNTTISREGLQDREHATEQGGLSGAPLFVRSTRVLAKVYRLTQGRIPLIGVGGIDSAAHALEKIEAGASLIQLYTGLVYEGLGLLDAIKQVLIDRLDETGAESLADLVGRSAARWAPDGNG